MYKMYLFTVSYGKKSKSNKGKKCVVEVENDHGKKKYLIQELDMRCKGAISKKTHSGSEINISQRLTLYNVRGETIFLTDEIQSIEIDKILLEDFHIKFPVEVF